jgi:hypothetical protein
VGKVVDREDSLRGHRSRRLRESLDAKGAKSAKFRDGGWGAVIRTGHGDLGPIRTQKARRDGAPGGTGHFLRGQGG